MTLGKRDRNEEFRDRLNAVCGRENLPPEC
jgi:hypothetical protein